MQGYAPEQLREALDRPLVAALGDTPPTIGAALEARVRQDNVLVTFAGQDGQARVHRLSVDPLPDGRTTCTGRDVTGDVMRALYADIAAQQPANPWDRGRSR